MELKWVGVKKDGFWRIHGDIRAEDVYQLKEQGFALLGFEVKGEEMRIFVEHEHPIEKIEVEEVR